MKRVSILLLTLLVFLTSAYCEASDFLADSSRYEYTKELFNDVDYTPVRLAVEEYIQTESPAPSDSAFAILDILEGAADSIAAIDETVDDFDGTRSFTLDGVDEICESYCVVPGYDPEDWLHVQMGFIADDWVFFDRIALSVDGEIVCEEEYDRSEKITEVLNGGSVLEKVSRPIDFITFEDAQLMMDGEKTVIRFSNSSTSEKYDHVLSDNEKSALLHCYQLLHVRTSLSNLYWNYSKRDSTGE